MLIPKIVEETGWNFVEKLNFWQIGLLVFPGKSPKKQACVGPYRLSTHCRHVVLLYFVQSQVWTRYFGTTLTLSRPVDENSNLAGLCDAMTSLENNSSLSVSRVDQAKQHIAAALGRHSNAATHRVLLRNKE